MPAPSPSCPRSLSPQHRTVPSVSTRARVRAAAADRSDVRQTAHRHRRGRGRHRAVAELPAAVRAPAPHGPVLQQRAGVKRARRHRQRAADARDGHRGPRPGPAVIDGLPSCPCAFEPQHRIVASARSAHAWSYPAAQRRRVREALNGQPASARTGSNVPSPRCPFSPSPQHIAVPSVLRRARELVAGDDRVAVVSPLGVTRPMNSSRCRRRAARTGSAPRSGRCRPAGAHRCIRRRLTRRSARGRRSP